MAHMYGGNILRVDLSNGKITKEPTAPYADAFLGGRGINIRLLYDGASPEIGPLDPASPLIFGIGPLCGTPVPASRVEVTGKSPETGFLGSSNFGGYFGPELKFAGYDNIVITGKADKPVYIWIDNERVEIRDASKIWGKDSYETQDIIHSEVDSEVKIACIGQAGENLVHFATIQHDLGHGAGRTGMGAVMGSKNLKAIVVRGTKGVTLADHEKYLSIAEKLQQEMRRHPGMVDRQKHGMAFSQDISILRAALGQVPRPVFSCDLWSKYQPGKAGCWGCPVQCMDLYQVEAIGSGVISCSFYCDPLYTVRNTDLDLLLKCGLLVQRYGIDLISTFIIIAWLMELYEKGVITAKDTDGIPMEWGSPDAIIGMLKKMVFREGFGDVVADGILPAAEKIGRGAKDYAKQVKGLVLYYHRTRDSQIASKGGSLSVVVASRGDNIRAVTETLEEGMVKDLALLYDEMYGEGSGAQCIEATRQKVKEITGTEKAFLADEYEGKPEFVIWVEDEITINDCLSACKLCSWFRNYPFNEKYEAALFSAGTGVETSEEMLFNFAKKVRNLERAYDVREGMTRDTDSLPKHWMDHPVEQGNFKGAVLESSKFEQMKSRYYALRGWDIATGIPTRETLEQAGLRDVAKDLEKRGKLPRKSSEGQQSKIEEH